MAHIKMLSIKLYDQLIQINYNFIQIEYIFNTSKNAFTVDTL